MPPEAQASLPVLWHEGDCIAIHKPAGWLVHRTGLDAGETRFVVQTLRDQLGVPVHPVHRLDKGTSGVLLMALSPDAARRLSGCFERREVHKRYVAMVRGWPPEQVHVDHALRPDDAPPDAPAQGAITDFRLLARCSLDVPVDRYPQTRVALVEATSSTWRTRSSATPPMAKGRTTAGGPNTWVCRGCGCTRPRSACHTRIARVRAFTSRHRCHRLR
jgi:tRNA pseudouridine65 synthase